MSAISANGRIKDTCHLMPFKLCLLKIMFTNILKNYKSCVEPKRHLKSRSITADPPLEPPRTSEHQFITNAFIAEAF